MKLTLHYFLMIPALTLGLSGSRAADETKPAAKEDKKQLRIVVGKNEGGPFGGEAGGGRIGIFRPGVPEEKETVTYLGVVTGPVSPTLTAQLGLPEGSGLVVVKIEPGSSAAGVLKEHDILLKLDDQLLIEQRQLSVLVRNQKEGDEVTLTYLRGGKQATARVKLAKHEVPKQALQGNPGTSGWSMNTGGGLGAVGASGNFDVLVQNPSAPQNREMFERMLPLMDGVNNPGVRRFQYFSRPGGSVPGERDISVTVNTGNSHVVLDDDQGSIELTIKDGKKDLVAKNAKGEQIFSGPVNTPDDRRALPREVRERFERLEDSTQFNFKPDGEFKAETKIFRPWGQGISIPPQPPAVPERRLMKF